MKKLLIIGFILLSQLLSAQDSIVYEDFLPKNVNYVNVHDNAVGLRYSDISGKGLSFSRNIAYGFSIVITGILQHNEKIQWKDMSKTVITYESSDILYNYGFELGYDMFKSSTTKFCAILGYSKSKDSKIGNNSKNIELKTTVGLGFNFQLYIHSSFSFELSAAYKYDDKDIQENNTPKVERLTNVGVGFGAKYHF